MSLGQEQREFGRKEKDIQQEQQTHSGPTATACQPDTRARQANAYYIRQTGLLRNVTAAVEYPPEQHNRPLLAFSHSCALVSDIPGLTRPHSHARMPQPPHDHPPRLLPPKTPNQPTRVATTRNHRPIALISPQRTWLGHHSIAAEAAAAAHGAPAPARLPAPASQPSARPAPSG